MLQQITQTGFFINKIFQGLKWHIMTYMKASIMLTCMVWMSRCWKDRRHTQMKTRSYKQTYMKLVGTRLTTEEVTEVSYFHAGLEQKTTSVLLDTSPKSWSVTETWLCAMFRKEEKHSTCSPLSQNIFEEKLLPWEHLWGLIIPVQQFIMKIRLTSKGRFLIFLIERRLCKLGMTSYREMLTDQPGEAIYKPLCTFIHVHVPKPLQSSPLALGRHERLGAWCCEWVVWITLKKSLVRYHQKQV